MAYVSSLVDSIKSNIKAITSNKTIGIRYIGFVERKCISNVVMLLCVVYTRIHWFVGWIRDNNTCYISYSSVAYTLLTSTYQHDLIIKYFVRVEKKITYIVNIKL